MRRLSILERRAFEWHEKHLEYLARMQSHLSVLEDMVLGPSARLLRIALDCQKQNVTWFRQAGFRISSGSPMFRNGQIGIVFSAAAVESAMNTALAVLCTEAKPRVQRALLMEAVVKLRNRETAQALKRFFPDLSPLDQSDFQELFSSRNEILHARPEYYENYAVHVATEGPLRATTKWTKSLRGSATEDRRWVTELPRYLAFALQIVERLTGKLGKPAGSKLPKMRKNHPILRMREFEAKKALRRKRRPISDH